MNWYARGHNRQTIGEETTRLIWGGDQIVLTTDGNNQIWEKYTYGAGLISRESATVAGGSMTARSIYMRNAHGDVVGLTDSTGAVSKTYDYDAFGNEIAPVPGDRNPFRYCGEFWDNDAGTYYLRARNYDPTIGRFLSEDTHWNVRNMIYGDREYGEGEKKVADIRAINQTLNLYAYCVSNPVSYVDLSGEALTDNYILGIAPRKRTKNLWCWVAVMAMIDEHYTNGHGSSQEQLAKKAKGSEKNQIGWARECAPYVSFKLSAQINSVPTFQLITRQMEARQPMILLTKGRSGASKHYVIIVGSYVQDGVQMVIINETRNGSQYHILYSQLSTGFVTYGNEQIVIAYNTTCRNG